MVQRILANGCSTSSMAGALRFGWMAQHTQVSIKMAEKMELGNLSGRMVHRTMASFRTIAFTATAFILGATVENMKANGGMRRCTAKAHFCLTMVVNTRENTRMITRVVWALSHGQMDVF